MIIPKGFHLARFDYHTVIKSDLKISDKGYKKSIAKQNALTKKLLTEKQRGIGIYS